MAAKNCNLFISLRFLLFLASVFAKNDVSYKIDNNYQGYCSFFNNRAPSAQPGIKNCTWFKENSCCLQQEIEVTFSKVKPLQGASLACQKYINYLMCYICAPNQHIFYQNERLTVCEDYCDKFYQACDTAVLKGSPIKDLYSSGKEFCLSRRFLVNSRSCFDFDTSLDTNRSMENKGNWFLILFFIVTSWMIQHICVCDNSCKAQVTDSTPAIKSKYSQTSTFKFKMFSYIISIILFSTLFITPCNAAISDKLNKEKVQRWARTISQDFKNLVTNGLQFEQLESIMNTADYELENINSTQKILEIREKLVTFFSDKEKLVKKIAEKVQQLFDDWMPLYSNVTTLSALPVAVYKDADLLSRLPLENFEHNNDYNSKVLLDSSVVKLPDSINRGNQHVIETVEWSAALDDVFLENMKSDQDIRWQYFGSSSGIHRSFPGREWSRNFIGFTDDFDPRSRPWYLSAVSGPKDVVIVIDASSSMQENNRLFRMKEVVRQILDTLTKEDRVNIVLSRSSHWNNRGTEFQYGPEVVSCQKFRLIQATASNRREIWAGVQTITAKGGSDHLEALKLAFNLLKNDTSQAQGNCQSIVIMATDADIRDGQNRCSRGFYKYYHDGTKEFMTGKLCKYELSELHTQVEQFQKILKHKANVITFVVDENRAKEMSVSPGRLACSNNGIIVQVSDDYNIVESMQPYFSFLQQSTGYNDTLWTSPYLDKSGLGLMMTASAPVYSKRYNHHLGVVGIDVPLEKIETILRHSIWGEVYAFMVDRKDLSAIIHPFAKPTAQLLTDPIFAPVWDLETHNGEPAEFVKVIEGILKADTGQVTLYNGALRPVSTEAALWWKPVQYTHYVYTDIPDSDFSIVLNIGRGDESEFLHKVEPNQPTNKNYLSNMEQYNILKEVIPEAYNELQPTTTLEKYPDIKVSVTHSVLSLAPRAFCDPTLYIHGYPNFTDIHTFLNAQEISSVEKEGCPNGFYNRDIRPEVKLTTIMERYWKERDPELQKQILWTYIGTASGVLRMYPGVQVQKDYDPTSRLWYTRTQANSHIDMSISMVYTDPIPSLGKVITLSKAIHRRSEAVVEEQCIEVPKIDGCACSNPNECQSKYCVSGLCTNDAIQAVIAMDIHYQDFQNRILDLKKHNKISDEEGSRRYCGEIYNCNHNQELDCTTRCYLITDTGHFSYDSAENDSTIPINESAQEELHTQQNSDTDTLASKHGFIFKKLVVDGIFIRNYRLDYQGVCSSSSGIPVVKIDDISSSSFHSTQYNIDEKGPIPPYHNEYSCLHETVYYHANTSVLNNESFITSGELTDDPCAEQGTYYFLPLPGTNLFLLVIEDYMEKEGGMNCHISNRVSQIKHTPPPKWCILAVVSRSVMAPGSFKLEYEVCPTRKPHINIPGSRSCHAFADISVPCGWSKASRMCTTTQTQCCILFLSFFCYILRRYECN